MKAVVHLSTVLAKFSLNHVSNEHITFFFLLETVTNVSK